MGQRGGGTWTGLPWFHEGRKNRRRGNEDILRFKSEVENAGAARLYDPWKGRQFDIGLFDLTLPLWASRGTFVKTRTMGCGCSRSS